MGQTDELHTLHPLVLNSKWLFGAQYDSPMFVSNSALTTVVKSLFKDEDYDLSEIDNPRKRPDIVALKKIFTKGCMYGQNRYGCRRNNETRSNTFD